MTHRTLSLLAAITALLELSSQMPALAQSEFKLGISGAATGPASPSYLPHIEGLRIYLRQLNESGGIGGKKIDVVSLDDKAAPSEAAVNAKRLMDDEKVLTVALMSLSSTYTPMFQAAIRTKTPILLLGQAVCPGNAGAPNKNPYVFCGGSTSDPITAGYWQVPLVKALAQKHGHALKLALVAMDIPISRQGIDHMENLAAQLGVQVVDKQAIPPAAADVSGAAARIIASGANYVTSWAPVTTAVTMVGALRRQGWDGWYVHNHSAEAEDTLRQLKDPKLVMSPEYAFTVEKLPVMAKIEAAAKKYGVSLPVDTLLLGWAGGMIVEAAFKQCPSPCNKERLLETLNKLSVDTAGIYPDPVQWSKDDHRRPASFTAYAWDPKTQSVKRITEWSRVRDGVPATVKVLD
ncbi:MAG: ABC transporter substrate-binding protein [Pseudolabrys sp.]|nr:ABC transporter substrate-binding protein [Pseudolabrys sp.]